METDLVITEELVEDDGILLLRVEGTYVAEMNEEKIRPTFARMRECGVTRLLVDYREGDFQIGTMTAYDRPQIFKNAGLTSKHRIAAVLKKISGRQHFQETVFANRGYPIRVFLDYEDAVTWLKGKEGSEKGGRHE